MPADLPTLQRSPMPRQRLSSTDVGTSAGFANHSGLILAARITFAHLAVSDLMTTANSSGELTDASRPSCAIRSLACARQSGDRHPKFAEELPALGQPQFHRRYC